MKKIALSILAFAPVVSFAQATQSVPNDAFNLQGFNAVLGHILSFINQALIPAIFVIAFLVFIWGVFKFFILGGSQQEKRDEGKKLVVWSIIGFVVMLSVWGIVNLVASSLGFMGERLYQGDIPVFDPTGGSGGGYTGNDVTKSPIDYNKANTHINSVEQK